MQAQTQANMLPPGAAATERTQKQRHRASVACASCRERRTRCVVLAGQSDCTQCRNIGQECIIKWDDQRRQPNSKAYISSLTDRITHLENLLREKVLSEQPNSSEGNLEAGEAPLPVPETSKPERVVQDQSLSLSSSRTSNAPFSHFETTQQESDVDGVSPQSISSRGTTSMVSKLLSTTGHLNFDELSGRLRYFGPVANCHIHSDLWSQNDHTNRQALEQQRRAEKAIRSISLDTHEYLMNLFWDFYNSVLHVVHQQAFEEGRDRGGGQSYSGFLHICILAMGYRFADKSRPDVKRISLPDKENTLQREAKYLLEFEIEQPGGLPSIVALLLLGDLETGSGRDNLGWLYAGMANRLCFEIGLHLDTSNSGASQRDIEIGRMTLWACIVYDRYWALFLGRPTMMKPADLEVYKLCREFERLGTCQPGPAKWETQIYEALLDLMELAGKITEIMDQASRLNTSIDHHVYFRMSGLHRELEAWYSHLPNNLQWTSENIATAPFSFFLLHQQYSGALILLHRPFARYDDPNAATTTSGSGESSEDDESARVANPTNHFSALSRTICTQHAVRISKIFWQHRQRFDTKQIFVTGLQHAGTAATALVAALAFMKDRSTRNNNMRYLECIAAALQDMSHTYVPAQRMSNVLEAVIIELRDTVPEKTKTVPARRSSSTFDQHDRPSNKRHQSFRGNKAPSIHEDEEGRPEHLQRPPSMHQNPLPPPEFMPVDNQTVSNQQHDARSVNSHISDNGFLLVTGSQQDTGIGDNGWHDTSLDLPSFDSAPASQHYRSTSFTDSHQPSQSFSGFTANLQTNHHQHTKPREASAWRSAWMGAETPRAGFSPAPPSPPASLHHAKFPSPPSTRAAHFPELDDFIGSGPLSSLLHPGDRLDFGSLDGMTIPMPMSGPMAPDIGFNNGKDLDGFSLPPLPTLKSSGVGSDWSSGEGSRKPEEQNTNSSLRAARETTTSPNARHKQKYSSSGDDQGRAITMAGLADILRKGGSDS